MEDDAEVMLVKLVCDIKKTDGVVTTCTDILYEERRFEFIIVVVTADYIKSKML